MSIIIFFCFYIFFVFLDLPFIISNKLIPKEDLGVGMSSNIFKLYFYLSPKNK